MAEATKVEIQGLKETQQALVNVAQTMSAGSNEQQGILSKAVLQLHRFMTNIVPVDTGRLKNSLHPFVEDEEASIRTNVVYALPVEIRTGYVKRTAEQEGPRVAEQVVIELGEEISDTFSA